MANFDTIKKIYEKLKERNMEDATVIFKEYFKLAAFWVSAAQIVIWIIWVLFFGQLLSIWDTIMGQMGINIWMALLLIALPMCQVAISSVGRITLDRSEREQPHYSGNSILIIFATIFMIVTFFFTGFLVIRLDYFWWTLCPYLGNTTSVPAVLPGGMSFSTTAICAAYSQTAFNSLVVVAIFTMLILAAEIILIWFLVMIMMKTSRLNDVYVHKVAGEMANQLIEATPAQVKGLIDDVHALYKKHGVKKERIHLPDHKLLHEAAEELDKLPHELHDPHMNIKNKLRDIAIHKY